ncbi:unnamed protein product [Caenorhabditis bovis]|uniref:G-protein coupled receptors family 1 profile domain-containing protein n=1 Tax=Caenorhabditis bovis TaxID=2654633 RepID=A0A8S1E8J8_9PELO|nr:unnamed protein product [Caenorhabditis bovis]
MILEFLVSTIFIFALLFNMYLSIVIMVYGDKTRIPTVYIYNLLMANSLDIIMLFIGFLLPMLWDDDFYYEFRSITGPVFTLICSFSYEHPHYLSLLMVIQRICSVYSPMTKLFNDESLWIYCAIIAILSLISLIIPFFSECQINMNQRLLTFESACAPNRHTITLIQNRYLLVIPFVSMILNIGLVLYLAVKRGYLMQNSNRSQSTSTVSVINGPHLMFSKKARNLERTLMLQSISTTTFILIYEVSAQIIALFPHIYSEFSYTTKFYIFYIRISCSCLLNFLVYGIATSSTRRLLVSNFKQVFIVQPDARSAHSTFPKRSTLNL